jgi:hypothetical protein
LGQMSSINCCLTRQKVHYLQNKSRGEMVISFCVPWYMPSS